MNRSQVVGPVAVLFMCVTVFVRSEGGAAIADAAIKGDAATIRRLLQQKADVNATQIDGSTALTWAVYRDDLETADLLLRAGADVKIANREGITALAIASLSGNAVMIERL